MSNEIQTIVKWFSDAKPNPTIEDVATQYGCHLEEFAELLSVTEGHGSCVEIAFASGEYKNNCRTYVEGLICNLDDEKSRIDLLDAFATK